MMSPRRANQTATPGCRVPASQQRAFSLVEILVVIAIMAVLLGLVFKGGPALLNSAKARETEALFSKLGLALEEYRREVDLSNVPFATNRYNGYPPDDLHVLQSGGTTAAGCTLQLRNNGTLLRNGSPVPDRFFNDPRSNDGQLSAGTIEQIRHGDVRAMVLSMRLFSPKATAILDTIDPKFWAEPDGYAYDPGDGSPPITLNYLLDAWGNPIEYFSTCICGNTGAISPRDRTSNAFVHDNNDGAILVSYGPDGSDQLSADTLAAEQDSTMVGDWYGSGNGPDNRINHRLNDDNVYSSEYFDKRIRN